MLSLLSPARVTALLDGPITIDLGDVGRNRDHSGRGVSPATMMPARVRVFEFRAKSGKEQRVRLSTAASPPGKIVGRL
jgi:hypothetical protein